MSNAASQSNTRKNLPAKSSPLAPKFFLNKIRELVALQNEYSEQGDRLRKYQLATAVLTASLLLTLALVTLNLIH